MKILDVFKKKVKPAKGKVLLSKKRLAEEHRELVKTLKTGSKANRQHEAKEQKKELKEYTR